MDKGSGNYSRFLKGDDGGFAEIIRDYKDGLIFYLNGFVGNIHIAEELCEDTFVKIVTKKPRFSGKSSFKTWLYAIGRNVAIDYIKKHSKAAEISAEVYGILKSEEEDLERAYIREERKIVLHRNLSELKPEYRQILWLIYFEDLSLKDAAQVMKKSVHNTETLVYRARKALKSQLSKEGFSFEEL